MRIPKDVFLHVLCSFFVFEHSFDEQLLSDGHVLLQLCKWSDADKATIWRRMHHIAVIPRGIAMFSQIRIPRGVRYEYDPASAVMRRFAPRMLHPLDFWRAVRRWIYRRRPAAELRRWTEVYAMSVLPFLPHETVHSGSYTPRRGFGKTRDNIDPRRFMRAAPHSSSSSSSPPSSRP